MGGSIVVKRELPVAGGVEWCSLCLLLILRVLPERIELAGVTVSCLGELLLGDDRGARLIEDALLAVEGSLRALRSVEGTATIEVEILFICTLTFI